MMRIALILYGVALALAGAAEAACSARFDGPTYTTLPSYNPFSPTDILSRKTIQIANLSGENCRYRVYFRRSPAIGRFSSRLLYTLTNDSGQSLLVEDVASSTSVFLLSPLASGYDNRSVSFNVGLARGQIASPALRWDDIELVLLSEDGRVQLDRRDFHFWIAVDAIAMVNVAGGGLATSVQFNTLATGLTRSLILEARSNTEYRITFSSSNGGNLVLDPPVAGHAWSIPYRMTVDGAIFNLGQKTPLQVNAPVTGQQSHSLKFQILDADRKRAGRYKDVIIVRISPLT